MKKQAKKPSAIVTIKLDPDIQKVIQNITSEIDRLCRLLEKAMGKGIIASN